MLKKLLSLFISFVILLTFTQTNAQVANAAFNCTLNTPEDGGPDHWKPASTKTQNLWLTLNHSPKEGFPEEIDAFITWGAAKPSKIEGSRFFTRAPGVVYMQNLITRDDIYKVGRNGETDRNWRSGTYRLTVTKKGEDSSKPLCIVNFEIKPYCSIDLNGGPSDYKKGWQPSFRVTEFNPYKAGGVEPGTIHYADLLKDGVDTDNFTENTAEKMLTDGISFPDKINETGKYQVRVYRNGREECKSNTFTIGETSGSEGCTDNSECADDSVCLPDDDKDGIRVCGISDEYIAGKIPLACKEAPPGSGKFKCQTAIGEINTDPNEFGKSILTLVLSIAGTILLVLIIINGFKLMTSQGDPDKIKDAREGIIAAIAGVLLIIFSLTILRIITTDILGIPGFR
jgi:hypothetical protein